MISLWNQEKLVIKHLRVKASIPDSQGLRWRLSDALNRMSLEPAGLPRSAILCIRSLHDPRSGFVPMERNALHASLQWERLLISSIEELARRAARPADGPVPANAPAVLFTDSSELLACLATDWCAGEVHSNWWWKSLLPKGGVDHAVISAWLSTPEYIPAALEWLKTKGLALSFLSKLDDKYVRQLIRSLIETYGLYELTFLSEHPARQSTVLTKLEIPLARSNQERATSLARLNTPWHTWLSDKSTRLSPERQVVLGVSLLLQRSPATVRSASFARQVSEWLGSLNEDYQADPNLDSHKGEEQVEEIAETRDRRPLPKTEQVDVALPEMSAFSVDPAARLLEFADVDSDSFTKDRGSSSSREILDQVTETAKSSSDAQVVELQIQSRFGGICYFINLGLYLNLYGDFTTPLQPGIELPIWDFVALLAQEIVGEQVTHDTTWSVLAQLAGRAEDEAPGARFDPPGYASLRAWLDDLMLNVRPRLQSALGVDQEELSPFFSQPARIVISATHLDAYFALAALPIEIRLSGLDRDPGWVPAAGRFVRFHYE